MHHEDAPGVEHGGAEPGEVDAFHVLEDDGVGNIDTHSDCFLDDFCEGVEGGAGRLGAI